MSEFTKPIPADQTQERYRLLLHAVESIRDYAIFLLDERGIVATWNEGAQRLKGYLPAEIIGQHFSKFYPLEDVEAGKTEYELEEASATGRFEDEGWRLRKDGTKFWANVVITAVRDPDGKVVGFSKITRDLTERRRAEERLRRGNEDLERRVAKRTEELTKAKADLEGALKSRDAFLSVASHELKTPITSLKLQAQMLNSKVDPASGKSPPLEKVAHSLGIIIRQSDRLATLVEYMLDISRVQLGKFTFNFGEADFSEFVRGILLQWEEPLKSAGCLLEERIEDGIVGSFDAYRLDQVLANLFLNVIKYAPGKTVLVTLSRQADLAELSVKDLGPGIELSNQDKIFERYERISTTSGVSGLGLGLFVAKTIVEGHGGAISVESELGHGSLFKVSLPLKPPTAVKTEVQA